MTYCTKRTTTLPFDEAVERVREVLSDEGFGVLCDVDVRATLERKLGVEIGRYRILGACNPALALEGLDAEPDLGTLLPCNVVVREDERGDVVVSAVDPITLLSAADAADLERIATDVADRFERVLRSLPETKRERSEAMEERSGVTEERSGATEERSGATGERRGSAQRSG